MGKKNNITEVNNQKNKVDINLLTPEIFPVDEAKDKFKQYFDKLKAAMDKKAVKNIAITGSYGSGKTTLIRNFENVYNNEDKEFLYVSLATFKEENHIKVWNNHQNGEGKPTIGQKKSNDEKNLSPEEKEKLERLIELSILQQLFFHVEPSELPNSKLKRIRSIKPKKQKRLTVLSLVWLFSATILFKFNHFYKLNPYAWSFSKSFDWLAFLLIVIFIGGIAYLISEGIKLLNSTKVNRLKFLESELELGDDVTKSILNEHIDEIIYFFQRTSYKVVVFEDIDRFENTEVFTKLREINLLLNNSKEITNKVEKVVFIYAVRDDKFDDQERTKFFDYIIPVIPYISPANAHQELWKLITSEGLNEVLSKNFTEDIIKLINTIDKRLLTNIFNEFLVYKSKLLPNDKNIKRNNNLLAMVIYKNLQPKDFAKLSQQGGVIFEILNKKNTHVKNLIDRVEIEIEELLNEVKNIENEEILKLEELRAIYINAMRNKLSNATAIKLNGNLISFDRLMDEDNFVQLQEEENIIYEKYQYHNASFYRIENNFISKISFSDIENEVNKKFTYDDREKFIKDKSEKKANELKKQIEILNDKKNGIESMDLFQVYQELRIVPDTSGLNNERLFRYLLLNGYINENYHHYISLFHGEDKKEFEFERKVKSGENSSFDYELKNVNSLIKRLEPKYFEREATLNHDLLNHLLNNKKSERSKLNTFLKQLSDENDRGIKFIDSYTELEGTKLEKGEKNNLSQFINLLSKNWNRFWDYIYLNSNYSEEKTNKYLKLIIQYSDLEDLVIFSNGSNIGAYAIQMENFFGLFDKDYYSKVKEFISTLNLKFENLTYTNGDEKELVEFVYKNNYYQINLDNIVTIFEMYHKDSKVRNDSLPANYQSNNFENILNSGCEELIKYIKENINDYVRGAYLKTENENLEKEEILTKNFLNNDSLDENLKIRIIEKFSRKFGMLHEVENIKIKKKLLELNKITPNWENVYFYLKDYEKIYIDETLINFYNNENNSQELSELILYSSSKPLDEFYKEIRFAILRCDEILNKNYQNLLKSIPKVYNDLDIKGLSEEKVQLLISNSKLTLTTENFDALKNNFPNNHISLLVAKQNEFVKDILKFTIDDDDIILLLKSEKITISNKIKIFEQLEETEISLITSNEEILKLSGRILVEARYSKKLDFDLLISLLKSSNDKLKLLMLQIDYLLKEQIMRLFNLFSYPYSELNKPRHRPTFKNSQIHIKLLNKLEKIGIIYPFEIKKGEDIVVVVEYD